ncbi:diaminopimelate epimerase [Epidermidibacterium keratini]|uniref:diaminopimelate epimerase n=1 Tax=Epidermidibacterium keratini TaxID=1891644 RepID=UPI001CEF9303|nr:diaminopimelate epimerase [Epidermidibacterium keratini]
MRTIAFAKGHGTENDFVLLPDPDGLLELDVRMVAELCHRHRGIGADGVLRVVRSTHFDGAPADAEWFMDYRNADGSIVEMCGNGVRVFARFLREEGLVDGRHVPIGTRAGTKLATFEDDGTITVDMGPPQLLGISHTTVGETPVMGTAISMGNPHLACDLAGTGLSVAGLSLLEEPEYDADFFPEGVNQEFYTDSEPLPGYDAHVHMRVHERGVGETRSCGTGICAVAVAALRRSERDSGAVVVDVPGGRLHVDVSPERVLLRGPAVVVARGTWNDPR